MKKLWEEYLEEGSNSFIKSLQNLIAEFEKELTRYKELLTRKNLLPHEKQYIEDKIRNISKGLPEYREQLANEVSKLKKIPVKRVVNVLKRLPK